MKNKVFQHKMREIFTRYKDRTALEYGNFSATYGELDERSSRAAAWILERGIEPGTFIGVLVEDRADLVTAIIGILKAGCAFVPLYSALPRKRIETMLEATRLRYLFIDDINARRFPGIEAGGEAVETVNFRDACALLESPGPGAEADMQYDPEGPVYIYFTSGTTGMPKAVVGRNKSLLHFIEWEIETFKLDCTSRVSQFTIPTFDPYLRDIFAPLLAGGVIVIPGDKDIVLDSAGLRQWLNDHRINLVHCVTSLLRLLCRNPLTPGDFKDLDYILLAGEKTNPSDLVYWYDVFGDRIRLVNIYGPTETTLAKMYYLIQSADTQRERIPVGKPIKGARVVILDEKRDMCDDLEVGEIVIRTPYRSLGYHNDPELNRSKFIQNPFNDDPNDIVYLTGDLGRILPDGNIDILGRIDRQVKIRGMRVELDEIEGALIRQEGVREAVVLKRELANSGEILHAFITLTPEETASTEDLIDGLKGAVGESLPEYMVPAVIEIIEQLPLRSNGKVDYEALKDKAARYKKEIVPPRNTVEKKLHAFWAELTGQEQFGVADSFFELGGNSLTVVSLISKIHKEFDVRVSLGEVFDNNTIEKQAAIIAGLVEDTFMAIEPVEKKEYYPLAPAQKRLYFLQQIDLESTAYNLPHFEALYVKVEAEKLGNIFKELIKRHESLRTSFTMWSGEPVQVIHDPGEIEFEIEYLSPDDTRGEQNGNGSTGGASPLEPFVRPFDLTRAPLLRVRLLERPGGVNILQADMHHIISDATSNQLLIADFLSLYRGEPLQPLKIRYIDYAAWKNRMEEDETIKGQEEYWLKEFDGEIPVLDLPVDYNRPAVRSFEGGTVRFVLGKEKRDALKKIAQEQGTTMYMVLLSIFYILVTKITNQEEILIGTPVAGRRHADLEKIIGMFVNTLVLRGFPEGGKVFLNFLDEIKEKTIAAFDNQDYQFEYLVEKVLVQRDTARNPLFDLMFSYHDITGESVSTPGGESSSYSHSESRTSKFDMILTVLEAKEEIHLIFEYWKMLFKKETINRFIDYFKNIVDSVTGDTGIKIADIDVSSEADKKQLLFAFNDTRSDYPRDKTLSRLFEDQAAKTPGNTAVVGRMLKDAPAVVPPEAGGEQETVFAGHQVPAQRTRFTYERLNERANRLAYTLRRKGVEADSLVGMMVDRSVEMIVGILAILKAGGAYLPMEPDLPPARIVYMLRDTGARLLLTQKKYIDDGAHPIECLDIEDENIYSGDGANLEPNNEPGSLSYVIYTSGTTGRPKGNLTMHYNVVRTVRNTNYLEIREDDRFLQLSNYAFDGSVFDIYGALLNGAALVLVEQENILSVDYLADLLKSEEITVFFVTTALFNALLDYKIDCLSKVRKVLFGGERISVEHAAKALEYMGKGRILHVYGPTETTVYASYYFIDEIEEKALTIPIGKPLANTTVYILDKNSKPVPIGVNGEVYIGGEGLARGYLNNPELTAERFVTFDRPPAQASEEPPVILYKTGDLGRWLPSGDIEFSGRIDHQVKIRGFRIEMGEIESQLLSHEKIKEAVVLAKESKSGDKQLYAYIVSPVEFTTIELREYLMKDLPGYMVPSYFVQIEKIPVNRNGKIDKKALEIYDVNMGSGVEYTAPGSEEEKVVAAIWQELLQLDKVGIHDNFFEIGGNSIKIIQLNSEIKKAFDRDIPIVTMFRFPTVSSFVQYLGSRETGLGDDDRAEALERGKRDRMQRLKKRKGATNG